MSQPFIVPTIKRPFPSKREIDLMTSDERAKEIRRANGRQRDLQSQAAAFQRYERKLIRSEKQGRRIKGNSPEKANGA